MGLLAIGKKTINWRPLGKLFAMPLSKVSFGVARAYQK